MSEQVDLETKIAFLERSIEELSGVVNEEARARQALENRLASLENAIRSGGDDVGPQNDPPPHY